MRILGMVVSLVFIAGCANTVDWLASSPDGKAVESAILWEAELDETSTPVAMAEVVNDPEQFEQEGYFYIEKHPSIPGSSIIIGAYTGP